MVDRAGGPVRAGHGPSKGWSRNSVVTSDDSVSRVLNMDMHTVVLGTSGTTAQDVIAVARGAARIELSQEALAAVAASRAFIDDLAAKPDPVYGVSTGFGALAVRHISPELRAQLQRNIVRSHAAGMGPRVEREVVRALMFLRLKTLASGRTGVRPLVVETMAALLNAGITPVVHEYGSLGCSGDLAPLSHCALTLLGEGDAEGPDGVVRPAGELLAAHGIAPVELREKEGLALLNGTDGMLGMLVMACADLARLFTSADITAALSLEALLGTDSVLAPELHAIRPHPGQATAAANMLKVLAGSGFTGHHQDDAPRVQDAYSIRCAPRSRAPAGTPSTTPAWSPTANWPPPSTTRWCCRTAGSSPTATSTARRSPTSWTSSPSPRPTSAPSRSAVRTASWTRTARTACPPSWPATRASTRA